MPCVEFQNSDLFVHYFCPPLVMLTRGARYPLDRLSLWECDPGQFENSSMQGSSDVASSAHPRAQMQPWRTLGTARRFLQPLFQLPSRREPRDGHWRRRRQRLRAFWRAAAEVKTKRAKTGRGGQHCSCFHSIQEFKLSMGEFLEACHNGRFDAQLENLRIS